MIDGYVYKQTAIDAICNDWCGTSNADCKNPFDPATDDYYHCDGCGDIELIKALPCEDVIPVSWIEEQIKWLRGTGNEFASLTAVNISSLLKTWRDEVKDGEQNE